MHSDPPSFVRVTAAIKAIKTLAGSAAIICSLLFSAAGQSLNKPPAQRGTFAQTVKDVGTNSITIQTGRNSGLKVSHIDNDGNVTGEDSSNTKTLQVNSFTRIEVDGLSGTLADIKPGMVVSYEQGNDPTVAGSIDAHTVPPAPAASPAKKKTIAQGTTNGGVKTKAAFRKIGSDSILAVSSTRITIGQPGSKMAHAFYITPSTTVTIDGAPAAASRLQGGMDVEVRGDSTTAEAIAATSAKDKDK